MKVEQMEMKGRRDERKARGLEIRQGQVGMGRKEKRGSNDRRKGPRGEAMGREGMKSRKGRKKKKGRESEDHFFYNTVNNGK